MVKRLVCAKDLDSRAQSIFVILLKYMNVQRLKGNMTDQAGRILLKGDNITLVQPAQS